MSEYYKILIADDDPDNLEQLTLLLQSKGFSVISAENSKDAFELFQKEKPDVVALDLMMEEMDSGFTLSYKIKKTDHGKKIPVIVVTSATYVTGYKFDAFTSDEKEWLKCDAILNKPINIDDLMKVVQTFYESKI